MYLISEDGWSGVRSPRSRLSSFMRICVHTHAKRNRLTVKDFSTTRSGLIAEDANCCICKIGGSFDSVRECEWFAVARPKRLIDLRPLIKRPVHPHPPHGRVVGTQQLCPRITLYPESRPFSLVEVGGFDDHRADPSLIVSKGPEADCAQRDYEICEDCTV